MRLSFVWLLMCTPALARAQGEVYDVVIRNGRVIDGTGSPWYAADVGIRDGRIAAIGMLEGVAARRTVDAAGMVVAPGFIDMLGQSELTILVNPSLPSKIFQGITTEITGEGGSAGPLDDSIVAADRADYDHYLVTPDWRTLGGYFARLEKQGIGINLASYVGATQVRRMVLGDGDRTPTAEELERMRSLVRDAMHEGAVGVSTALQYPPAPYARTAELVALATEAAKLGGVYATHLRSEGDQIDQAIDEAITIGREARIPVEIWHLKAAGKRNWGRMPHVVAKIDSARKAGVDIAADRIRREMLTPDESWDNEWQEIPGPSSVLIGVVQNPALEPYMGKTLAQVAALRHTDAITALLDLLAEDQAYTSVAVFGMSEPDVTLALEQPWVSIDNDSQGTSPDGLLGKEHPHPRAYGTFPRILRKYVREERRLSLEDAIRKFTSLPAQRMRLGDRGVVKVGMWADLVIFDPATVRDRSTFAQPNQLAEGMRWVLVNGIPVIEDGQATGALPGQVLRGAGYRGE